MRKIALETKVFVKKNRYLKMNFTKVLRKALVVLFIEYLITFALQLSCALDSSLQKFISSFSVFIPIVLMILYICVVLSIFMVQTKKLISLILLLKVIEFLFFTAIMSKLNNYQCV